MFISNQMVLYIFPHYVCTCVYMHTNTFWNMRLHLGCVFQCPVPLDCPSEEGDLPSSHPKFVLKNLREICFALYCSHPDCLKLPHAEKQSENVEFKSELTKKKFSFQVDLNGHLLLWVALSSEGAMSSVIHQTPPTLNSH